MGVRGLISLSGATQICRISRQAICERLKKGKFPSPLGKIGEIYVWDEEEIKQWNEKRLQRPLTKHQEQILSLLAKGLKASEIASAVGISLIGTYKTLGIIRRKLDVNDNGDAINKAIELGIITTEENTNGN